MIYKTLAWVLLLALICISVPEAVGQQDKPFPTSLDYGKIDSSGRFVRTPVVCKESLPTQVMSPDNARFKIDLNKLLDPYNMVWTGEEMPVYFYDGAPLGNGDMGALIYGYPDNLHIVLGKTDVWDRRNDVLDVSHLPGKDYNEFRQTYYDNDWDRYLELNAAAATARREKTLALPHMTTCGQIQLCLDGGMRKHSPQMEVSLKEGLANLAYSGRLTRALVSREYDVLLIDIDRGAPEADPADPVLANRYGSSAPATQLPWEFRRTQPEGNDLVECVTDGRFHFATQRFRAGNHYTVGITFTNFDKDDSAILPSQIVGTLSSPQQRHCQMYVTIVSSEDAQDTMAECKRRLQRAIEAGADTIIEKHCNWWQDYWMRGLASVADKAVEKWYYLSLYHCGSAYQPGRQSPGLQGVWSGDDFSPWCSDFHSNINMESNYWGLMTNNRLDMMEPFISHYYRTADVARQTAKEYYKMRGLRFPHGGSIGGTELCRPDSNMLGTDPCGSAWLGHLFWQYYQYSRDENYLRQIAYPILRDIALFYTDFMVRDKKTGKWVITPSVNGESKHRPPFQPFFYWGDNSLWAQTFFRLGFHNAIQAAGILGVDQKYQTLWKERLTNMAPPPVSKEGHWKNWDNHELANGFLLSMVYPAELVSLFHGPDEWRQQALKTAEDYSDKDLARPWFGGINYSGLLRMGKVDEAFEGARWKEKDTETKNQFGIANNGFAVSYKGAYFEADHPAGMCVVLADMLVLGLDGTIHLFAGLPENQPARCLSLRAPGGFLITAEKRGTELDYAIIQSTADKHLKLANPWKSVVTVTDLQDKKVIYTTEEPIIEVELAIGQEYLIVKKGFDINNLPMVDFSFYE